MNTAQTLKDMVNSLLRCLRDMGHYEQEDIIKITSMIDRKFNKEKGVI